MMNTETKIRDENDRVIIFDTTLRDGEQCPGATMTFDEKLEVAELLDEMGEDGSDPGFLDRQAVWRPACRIPVRLPA